MNPLFVFTLVGSVVGWGREGHREITRIALDTIDDKIARRFLRDHLGAPESIIEASLWADTDEASAKYPDSEDLHFSNTPWRACDGFNMTRDCGFGGSGECIVTGIAKMALIASDPIRPLEDRIDTLKFLIHLVADIHQPLHTGFAEDNGGGNIWLLTEPPMNLHQMWDYGISETEGEGSPESRQSYTRIEAPSVIDSKETMLAYASELASESSTMLTCTFAYRNEAGEFIRSRDRLSPEYLASRKSIVQDRIRLAGERLAQLLTSVANSFRAAKSPLSAAPETVPEPLLRFENRFAVLEVELEPDDLVEESNLVLERRGVPVTTPKPDASKNRLDEFISDPKEQRIGTALLSNVVLIKQRERYVLTCANLVRENPNYEAFQVASFRVRFSKNRRHKDPIFFFVDLSCFGRSISQSEFINVLYYLGGTAGSRAMTSSASVTRLADDVVDIAPINGEYAEKVSKGIATGRFIRGWSPYHLEDDFQATGAYLSHLRGEHMENQYQQAEQSRDMNISLHEKWDREFFSKLSAIRLYRFGRLQIVIQTSTLTNPDLFELKFAMFGCVSTSPADALDPSFVTLIDSSIFDGYITPRIAKGLASLAKKQSAQEIDSAFRSRLSFLDELHDIDLVLSGFGRGRSLQFKAIKGYYMYPSILSGAMAYIEWTLVPYFLLPEQDAASGGSPASTTLARTSL
jgi:hypothetical protein